MLSVSKGCEANARHVGLLIEVTAKRRSSTDVHMRYFSGCKSAVRAFAAAPLAGSVANCWLASLRISAIAKTCFIVIVGQIEN